MEIILRGVRGGIAAPAPDTSAYGGNTACLEVRPGNGVLIFLDAGTGLREAGEGLPESGEAHVFISHGHADHVAGLWFFKPLHSPAWTTRLYLPEHLASLPDYFYQCGFFPVPVEQLRGRLIRCLVRAGESVFLGPAERAIQVEAFAANHPGGCLGWRLTADNAVFVYSGDHEIAGENGVTQAAAMLAGADLAVVDAQYGREDHQPGFGHSAWEDWVEAARQAGVRHLILTHHAPGRSDEDLDRLAAALREAHGGDFLPAAEGMRFSLGLERSVRRGGESLLPFLEDMAGQRDSSSILDSILTKARDMTQADAGTIFLCEGADMVFAYTHNDSLFSVNEAYKHAYSSLRLPVSEHSIAGYAAATGRILNIADARALPRGVPYSFNESFDRKTGYVTRSMLVLPFRSPGLGRPLGVMQLINSLGPDGRPRPFTAEMERACRFLAREVSGILARSEAEKNGIYGILRMAAVHDPCETGPHAERVGSIAAELFHVWADAAGLAPDALRHEKGKLRLAAMLHDIGKVGISDLVLKKPGKLTEEEFAVMRGHTALGASILADDPGDIAALAHDIALHHHQKWNGRGYAGSHDEGRLGGEAIPLGARITAIADVFDALVSPRCYKKPWTFADALDLLRREAGEHFDPALVERMTAIGDLLVPIYERFPDKD
jgi:phosphoribosyl 1,2-cyclic phosphodiesterase